MKTRRYCPECGSFNIEKVPRGIFRKYILLMSGLYQCEKCNFEFTDKQMSENLLKGSSQNIMPVSIQDNNLKNKRMAYMIGVGPKFIVNLRESNQYLTINVRLLIKGQMNIKKLKKMMPILRHELIMVYSGRARDELQTMAQREALCRETKNTIVIVLEKYSNIDGFKDVFFTEFLLSSG